MISVKNLTKIAIDENLLKGVAKIVLKGENIGRDKELSIVLVKGAEIKRLNKKYRKKDQTTDVLSFEGDKELGEIVICLEEVKKNAKEIGSTFKKELIFVLIHGILHLSGYDHELSKVESEKMKIKEDKYLSLC